MKHLRYINESTEDKFDQDIKDILLEVEDLGFTTRIDKYKSKSNLIPIGLKFIQILFYNNGINNRLVSPFQYKDVKDCVLRLRDYLGDRYHSCQVFCESVTLDDVEGWESYELIEDNSPDGRIESIIINYKYEILKII